MRENPCDPPRGCGRARSATADRHLSVAADRRGLDGLPLRLADAGAAGGCR